VSVIAPLDYEHTANPWRHDGRNRANKAGIIKPGPPVVTAAQPADGLAVIERGPPPVIAPAAGGGTRFDIAAPTADFAATGPWGEVAHLRTRLAGRHQAENATLAIAAVHASVGHRRHRDPGRRGAATLPGRFEEVQLASGQVVIIDGAHSGDRPRCSPPPCAIGTPAPPRR